MLLLGVVLGVAGASFAVALPLASRWYPPEHQGIALGIAGAGNSGTVFAALFAPGLAAAFGWTNVLGLAAHPADRRLRHLPRAGARTARTGRRRSRSPSTSRCSAIGDAWWFMFFYGVTFGGFFGLASSLPIYFNDQYGLAPSRRAISRRPACSPARWCARSAARWPTASAASARCRVMYTVAAVALVVVSFGLPQVWMALARLRRRHAGARHGQRRGVPAGAAALPRARSAS